MRVVLAILIMSMAIFAGSRDLETQGAPASNLTAFSESTTENGRLIKTLPESNNSMTSTLNSLQEVTADDGVVNDRLGSSVAIDGDTAVVGAPASDGNANYSGKVYVFVKSGNTWTQQQTLLATDGATGDRFGTSVAISGDVMVIGASGADGDGKYNVGAAYVFTRSGENWTEQTKLMVRVPVAYEDFGTSVAIDRNHGMVGAKGSDSAYYISDGLNGWAVRRKLNARDHQSGSDFGISVAIEGDTAVIGANDYENASRRRVGAAYVFTGIGIIWTERQKLTANDAVTYARFGISVAIDASNILIGADADSSYAGAAYLFSNNGANWIEEVKLVPSDSMSNTYFGKSVAIDGENLVVGSFQSNQNGPASGAAYLFEKSDATWMETNKLLVTDGAEYDNFGTSVCISGLNIIGGAPGRDILDSSSGLSVRNQGAAYFYSLLPPAFEATISGKVLKRNGRGFPQTLVHLTEENGDVRTTRTDPFGNFTFGDVLTQQTLTLNADHNGHQFNTLVIDFVDSITEANITHQ